MTPTKSLLLFFICKCMMQVIMVAGEKGTFEDEDITILPEYPPVSLNRVVVAFRKGAANSKFSALHLEPYKKSVDLDNYLFAQTFKCNLPEDTDRPAWDGEKPELLMRKVTKSPLEPYVQMLVKYKGKAFPVATYLTTNQHKKDKNHEHSVGHVVMSETRVFLKKDSKLEKFIIGLSDVGFYDHVTGNEGQTYSHFVSVSYKAGDGTVTITHQNFSDYGRPMNEEEFERVEIMCQDATEDPVL